MRPDIKVPAIGELTNVPVVEVSVAVGDIIAVDEARQTATTSPHIFERTAHAVEKHLSWKVAIKTIRDVVGDLKDAIPQATLKSKS